MNEAIKHMIPDMRPESPKEDQQRAWKLFLLDELSKPFRIKDLA